MKILVTMQQGRLRDLCYSRKDYERLEKIGEVTYNNMDRPYTSGELKNLLNSGVQVVLSQWGCPKFTEDVLNGSGTLRFIAHAAGSVSTIMSGFAYDKGIRISSANDLMAKHVAEGALALILSAGRQIPKADLLVKQGGWDGDDRIKIFSIFGAKISMIGLGTIGRYLYYLLKPFDVNMYIYDPYISADDLKCWHMENACLVSLEEALSFGDIVSVHASLTTETVNLLREKELALIKPGSLLINTARAAIINEEALLKRLSQNNIYAALDVFHKEPLPADSPLTKTDNCILTPHMSGKTVYPFMVDAMIDEIERFIRNQPLLYEISRSRAMRMTDEAAVNQ